MCISDWSSDVGSSDLGSGCASRHPPAYPQSLSRIRNKKRPVVTERFGARASPLSASLVVARGDFVGAWVVFVLGFCLCFGFFLFVRFVVLRLPLFVVPGTGDQPATLQTHE